MKTWATYQPSVPLGILFMWTLFLGAMLSHWVNHCTNWSWYWICHEMIIIVNVDDLWELTTFWRHCTWNRKLRGYLLYKLLLACLPVFFNVQMMDEGRYIGVGRARAKIHFCRKSLWLSCETDNSIDWGHKKEQPKKRKWGWQTTFCDTGVWSKY